MIKKGDKVTVRDGSYSFGVDSEGEFGGLYNGPEIFQVLRTGLRVVDLWGRESSQLDLDSDKEYCIVCDTLITNDRGFWFLPSRFLKNVEPEIEITVKVNGKEVSLKSLSEETLLNIRNKT